MTLTSADLYGVVTDHLGNPVPGATIYATGMNEEHRRCHDLTSGSGYYAIGGLGSGTYLLTAEPPWYEGALLPPTPITVTLPLTPQEHDLTFGAPPKVVTGTVETNTGDPVLNARVVAHRLDKGGRVKTLSGSDGGYQLDLSDGLWALTVKVISTTMPSEWVYPSPPQLVHFQHDPEPSPCRCITTRGSARRASSLPMGPSTSLCLTAATRCGSHPTTRATPAHFSTTTNEWTFPESYVVDIEANRAVMQVDHFTDFALTSEPGFRLFLPVVVK
ncbi:MAG: carboxypeptidase regulatory-like domain-containing protein [Anaerolineae bacterium]|nr:carboxypeptidase regulatory-like domain-containing protein [Anaerolineae bacterium]